jgi:hypothetical protein
MNPGAVQQSLTIMLAELESHQLCVCLAPLNPKMRGYNDGGCKRVLMDRNPLWYRNFCAEHASSRGVRRGKFDTKIRRRNTIRVLARMEAGKKTISKYAGELLAIAQRQARKERCA